MRNGHQIANAGLQKVQMVVSKALIPVMQIIDTISDKQGEKKPVASYLGELTSSN